MSNENGPEFAPDFGQGYSPYASLVASPATMLWAGVFTVLMVACGSMIAFNYATLRR